MGESKASGKAGKKIGKYQNAVLLAKGGMGAIYKADHPTLNQPVVLKMLTLTGNEQFTQRFQREATIMMGFQHVNIVNYFDHFKTAKSYCMVMELVDGCSVAQLLEKHRYLDDDVALLILRDTLRALVFAHEKSVVHRDIKPANILISKEGEVKLTDFGIAHNQSVDTDGLTKEGMTLGTPSYMAPEQFRDAGSVDGRADVYSAGVLLYECLTGRKPFAGASLPELLERIRKSKYEKLRKIRPESSYLSRRIIRKAIRSRPKWRYQTAQRMLEPLNRYISRRNEDAIRRQLADLVTGRRPGISTSKVDKRRILRIGMIASAGLAGLVLISSIWWFLSLSGFMPVFLLPDFAGGIRLEVPLPDNSMLTPHVLLDVFQFDSQDEDSMKEIRAGLIGREPLSDTFSRLFNIGDSRGIKEPGNSSDSPKLVIRPVVVKPGLYQLKIRVGDVIHTKAVQIPSMKDLRRSFEDGRRQVPLVVYTVPWEPETGPVFVTWSVRRSDSGSELTTLSKPGVVGSDGIVYAVSGNNVELNTGRYYDFTFSAPDYETRTVRAWLESGISDYFIDVNLLPRPAELSLSSTLLFRKPKLQGETVYRYGGDEGGFRRIPFLKEDLSSLYLLPGEYRLSCGNEGKSAEIKLNLKPGDAVSYRLIRSDNKELKWIEVKNE